MDNNLRREIIIDAYQNPHNRGLVDDSSYLTNKQASEGNIVKDIRFDGEACAISTSATSIMIDTLIGKNIEEVEKILKNYYNMVQEEEYNSEVLGDLIVFDEIYKQPNRKKCALLPGVAIKAMLDKLEEENGRK